MANIQLQFLDIEDGTKIEVKSIPDSDIISILTFTDAASVMCIHLDKSTAIKLAKTLRTEINKIQ